MQGTRMQVLPKLRERTLREYRDAIEREGPNASYYVRAAAPSRPVHWVYCTKCLEHDVRHEIAFVAAYMADRDAALKESV